MILFSTGGWKDKTAFEATIYLKEMGINSIELSGGKPKESFLEELKSIKDNTLFAIHNYFPPPVTPFVFNLASNNDTILSLSLNHAKKAIDTAAEIGIPVYSFHAGFLFDPIVDELGKKFGKYNLIPRQEGFEIFIHSLKELGKYAASKEITLLIENNVISKANFERFNGNPLLFTEPTEAEAIMKLCPPNIQTLVDVGHLLVSSITQNFAYEDYFQKLDPWINAYHLSDNNGFEDQNLEINPNSWFWKFLKSRTEVLYASLEIYNINKEQIIKQYGICNACWK